MIEVFKRLADKTARFLDERHQELPVPEEHKIELPLFCQRREA